MDNHIISESQLLNWDVNDIRECAICLRAMTHDHFDRAYGGRDDRKEVCRECAQTPRLSMSENLARLKENNYRSAQSLRWSHNEDFYLPDSAKWGHPLYHVDLISRLKRIVTNGSLVFTEGRIIGDLCCYWVQEGKSPQYLFYVPMGKLPEFSIMQLDEHDVPLREKQRGWRTVLLRLIIAGVLTEDQVKKEFGQATGEAAMRYNRELFIKRNGYE